MDGPDGFRAAGGMRSMPSTPLRHGPQSRPLLSAGISVSAAGILHSLAAGRARMERQQPASSHGTADSERSPFAQQHSSPSRLGASPRVSAGHREASPRGNNLYEPRGDNLYEDPLSPESLHGYEGLEGYGEERMQTISRERLHQLLAAEQQERMQTISHERLHQLLAAEQQARELELENAQLQDDLEWRNRDQLRLEGDLLAACGGVCS
ncbi:hypothetical protein T484DRAFT_1828445 [Baffinella frigidus]|nr:hypothetical protein T484DRAFT_1828445 [Cryptophyta sp. CCMP2293]